MARFEIVGNKIISESLHCTHTFEIVDKITDDYFVWNIGENMGHPEYIPLCIDLYPGNKESFEINTLSLRAIKLPAEEVKLLREAAHVGIVSKKAAEKAIKSTRSGYWSNKKREQAEKTIEIFNRITA